MENKEDADCSFTDDEIFFGRLTLKEVKKRIFMDVHQKYITKLARCEDKNYDDNEIKIIEASSQPNMFSTIDTEEGMVVESLKSTSDPLFNRQKHVEPKLTSNPECEDSFLELEEKVTEQCQSSYNCDKNFDNTLEFVDFILKHAQSQEKNVQDNNVLKQEIVDNKECCEVDSAHNDEILSPINIKEEQKSNKENDNTEKSICATTTPVMKCDQTEILSFTHNPRPKVAITFSTPSSNKKETSDEILSPINIKDEQKSNKGNDNSEKSICAPTTPVMKCDQTEILSSTHNPRPKVAITFSTPSSNNKETSDEMLSPINTKDEQKSNKLNDNSEKSICAPTTPVMKCDQTEILSSTHNPRPKVAITFSTPSSNKKETSNIFKTPKIPLSSKKDASGKKTPSRLKAYQHIASPIATYIRNCPQVPLVKDVHPRKPLPSTSFIPKLMKNAPEIKSDKENILLPSLAYRNAKKTLVIDVNKEKLPQNSWAQKLTGVPRKPVVMKHNHREAIKKPLSLQQQEDSFEDLTLHQADVSVCTQKLAFQKL